jgi:hypothetical protein
MSTLKDLLVEKLESEGLAFKDVAYVAVGGIGFRLSDFWEVAGTVECDIEDIKDDFVMTLKDHTWISKHYSRDGSVRFKYHLCPERPSVTLIHPQPQEFLDKWV